MQWLARGPGAGRTADASTAAAAMSRYASAVSTATRTTGNSGVHAANRF